MSEHGPKLSIGMPVYNGEAHISQALDSLLEQSFTDFEIIISDNASTDRTQQICREYQKRDSRIKYFEQEHNFGAVANYNAVFELASGEYFKWAACNDTCLPEMLSECIDVLDRNADVVLCYPKTMLIDESGSDLQPYDDHLNIMDDSAVVRVKQLLISLSMCNAFNGVLRTEALLQTKVVEDFLASDVSLLVRLCLLGKFYEVPKRLFNRRMHPNELSHSKDVKDLLRFYNPSTKQEFALKFCRLNLEHFKVVWQSSVSMTNKMKLFAFLARKLIWERKVMFDEVKAAISNRRG